MSDDRGSRAGWSSSLRVCNTLECGGPPFCSCDYPTVRGIPPKREATSKKENVLKVSEYARIAVARSE